LPSEAINARVDGPERGPAIVLSNSLGTNLSMWSPQLKPLVDAGYRVVRYDARGHGESASPPTPYTIEDLGRDLVAVLDRFEIERAHVAGVSLGGATAMWAAVHAPERVGRLVVCCSAVRFGEPSGWEERAELVREHGMAPVAEAIAERWFTPRYLEKHPNVVVEIVHALALTDPEGYAGCCEAIRDLDLSDDIAAIKAPTLVIAGAQDPVSPPADGQFVADRIPGARIEIIDPGAHLSSVERHDVVTQLILDHLGGAA
jgi:3-oxoadipate enol-lactonase